MSVLDALAGEVTTEGLFAGASLNKLPVITCEVLRELTQDDLIELQADRDEPGAAPPLKSVKEFDVQKVRARHHAVARYLAQGMAEGLVATITGFTASTISLLKNSPAMQELIEHYRLPTDQAAILAMEKLRHVAGLALDEMEERLNTDPEAVKTDQLVAIAKLGLDRSGIGPTSTTKVDGEVRIFDAAALAAMDQRARLGDRALIIPLDRQKALPSDL